MTDLHDHDLWQPRSRASSPWHDDGWDDPAALIAAETAVAPRRPRVLPWVLLAVGAVLVVAAVVGGLIGWWVIRQVNPPGGAGEPTNFVVQENDDLVSISTRLKQDGFITHAGVFQWYVKRQDDLEFVPGYYTIRPRDTMGNIAAALRTPPNATFTSVTFPEGFTVEQIAQRLNRRVPRLAESDVVAAAESPEVLSEYRPSGTSSLEGLLFPDTYQVSNAESALQVVQRMVRLMERVGRQEGLDDPLKRNGRSPYEVLIVASLIEREAKTDGDRPKIARVIYNRLARGMTLDIDAALYYGNDPSTPFSVLKAKESPYNLYRRSGLPPTPIASPGRESIRAALNPSVDPPPGDPICRELPNPTACQYLYYVLIDKAGNHAFSATLEQHERNIETARAAGVLP